jgi:alkylation response protein AidB-like acyl-CoA dehydrogenase
MRWIGQAEVALDMMVDRALNRYAHGSLLADKQGIQWMIADSAMELYQGKLMVLHAAYKIDRGEDFRSEVSMVTPTPPSLPPPRPLMLLPSGRTLCGHALASLHAPRKPGVYQPPHGYLRLACPAAGGGASRRAQEQTTVPHAGRRFPQRRWVRDPNDLRS